MEKSFVNQFSPDLSLLVRGAKLQGWWFSELLGRDLSGANTGTRILFCNELEIFCGFSLHVAYRVTLFDEMKIFNVEKMSIF